MSEDTVVGGSSLTERVPNVWANFPEVGVEVEHGGEDEGGKDRDHHRHENIHVVRGEKGCHG